MVEADPGHRGRVDRNGPGGVQHLRQLHHLPDHPVGLRLADRRGLHRGVLSSEPATLYHGLCPGQEDPPSLLAFHRRLGSRHAGGARHLPGERGRIRVVSADPDSGIGRVFGRFSFSGSSEASKRDPKSGKRRIGRKKDGHGECPYLEHRRTCFRIEKVHEGSFRTTHRGTGTTPNIGAGCSKRFLQFVLCDERKSLPAGTPCRWPGTEPWRTFLRLRRCPCPGFGERRSSTPCAPFRDRAARTGERGCAAGRSP